MCAAIRRAFLFFAALTTMRNTTKLKILLQKYTVSLDMNEDESFVLVLADKTSNNMQQFEGESYSRVLAMAYSYLLRTLKQKHNTCNHSPD